jgi:ATPase involved in DNA repair
MIVFERIRWQNFLSYGNYWTEIDLNTKSNTLIVGANGSGKSTFLDAISYVLFGRAYRDINKPDLINSINSKNTLVEIEFTIGKKAYKIRRGMKPNIFEIFIDGEMLKQDSLSKDTQAFLENNILKINHKSFGQIVILGSANYVPFMQLSTGDRRKVIEDLLDLQVFSAMNQLLKERIVENKDLLTSCEYNIKLIESSLKLHNEHLKDITKDIKEQKKELTARIAEEKKNYKQAKHDHALVMKEAESIDNKLKKYRLVEVEIEKITLALQKLDKQRLNINKQIDFYNVSCKCNTCKQSIDEAFKEKFFKEAKDKLDKIMTNEKLGKQKIKQLEKKFAGEDELEAQREKLSGQLLKKAMEVSSIQMLINSFENDLAKLTDKLEAVDTSKKKEFEKGLVQANKEREELIEQKEVLSVASQLLKDGGIKTLIIRQYIPVMNKIINQYLAHMNHFIEFSLDENFNETVKARHFDARPYAAFSQGEKARIDLSILFSWRAIAKMRNTAATNLLIFDEIFDGSLDVDGLDDFMKILNTLVGDTNVFIISHKTDNISDRFDHILKFEQKKNFSKMEIL